jgi:hypothetical protein
MGPEQPRHTPVVRRLRQLPDRYRTVLVGRDSVELRPGERHEFSLELS